MTTTEHHVRPGQIWADADPRSAGRTLRVERIEHHRFSSGNGGIADGVVPYAVCTVLTGPTARPWARRGHKATIRVSRFKPTSTGYRLVTDVPA